MNDERLFSLFDTVRGGTLNNAEKIATDFADKADTIPDGYRNNLRWNLGHIATVTDQLAHGPAGKKPTLPKPFAASFANGTSPDDWNDETPSLQEIITVLREQPAKLKETFLGKLAEPFPEPFSLAGQEFQNGEEMFIFALYHEGLHQGTIGSMLKVL